jgi:protoporphyrinogen oxidase
MKPGKYDVVIIGAGVGGMCAAALLTHDGYKTLLVERTPLLGGRCSTMEYKGFKLTTGVINLSPGGNVNQIFDQVGAPFDIGAEPHVAFRVNSKDYEMPSQGGLRWLLSQVSSNAETEKMMGAIKKAFTWQEPAGAISFYDWLRQYTQNETILNIFQALVSSQMVVNSWELSARGVIRFLELARSFRVCGFARHGNMSLWESLAKVITGKGGDIWTECPAKRILVNRDVATGVVVEKAGKEVEVSAQVVISDAGPRATVELAGSDNFDKGYLKELNETLRPSPIVWVQSAINTPHFNHQGWITITDSRRVNAVVCPTIACPELAPKGKHLLLSGSGPVSSLPPFDFKKEIELHLMDLGDNFPEFTRYGEVLNAGCFWGEWPGTRTWPGYEMPQKTSIVNLYNVGDAVVPSGMGSTPGVAESARLVVADLKQRIRPAENTRSV